MESETNLELLAEDIRRQPALLRSSIDGLRGRIGDLAAEIGRPSRIYIVGCGDSLNVGMAVRFEWERLLGIPVHAIPALTERPAGRAGHHPVTVRNRGAGDRGGARELLARRADHHDVRFGHQSAGH